jgi:acyl-CoA synthetase (AMP-forming)/AMP-acid ligase II
LHLLTLRLGGAGERPAVTVNGRTWSYREFAEQVDLRQRIAVDQKLLPATGTVVEVLAAVFAAAAVNRPVLVTDPAGPVPTLDVVPPEAFLAVVTSGTSGRPKAVLRSAASWVSSFAPLAELTGIGSADRVLLTGPLHATLHLFAAVHTLVMGAELTDRAEQATAVHAVPAVFADLLDALPPDAPLRVAVLAGSSLPDELADRATARAISVVEYYGAAELSFVAARRHPQSLRPFPGAEVQIRDGVLWVRSPFLSLGYPAGTVGPFRRDEAGFGTVGDLAEWAPDGGLLIRGRGDAAITTGGATVIAEDVESALAALPGVAAVAVVGLPHSRLGQLVTAVIEPSPDANLGDLRAAARRVLRDQSLPRRWLVTDRLPRTPSGKVNRHAVALAAARSTGNGAPASGSQPPDGNVPAADLPVLRPLP